MKQKGRGTTTEQQIAKKGPKQSMTFISAGLKEKQVGQSTQNGTVKMEDEKVDGKLMMDISNSGGSNGLKKKYGIGAKLLMKMGFKPGFGLGKDLQGISTPVVAQKNTGRHGLGTGEFSQQSEYELSESWAHQLNDTVKPINKQKNKHSSTSNRSRISFTPNKTALRILVPREMLNVVKGPNDSTIKRIQQKNSVNIVIANDERNKTAASIIITFDEKSPINTTAACKTLVEIMNEESKKMKTGNYTFKMLVPDVFTRFCNGKGIGTLDKISKSTGATINVSNFDGNAVGNVEVGDRIISIEGTAQTLSDAQSWISREIQKLCHKNNQSSTTVQFSRERHRSSPDGTSSHMDIVYVPTGKLVGVSSIIREIAIQTKTSIRLGEISSESLKTCIIRGGRLNVQKAKNRIRKLIGQ